MLNQQKFENASSREEQLAMMIEELKKKKKAHKKVLIPAVIFVIGMMLTLTQYSDYDFTGEDIYFLVSSIVFFVIFFVVLFFVAKKKAKQFEAELDEQTTDEEKMLYK